MENYNHFPPVKYFIRVLKNYPDSAYVYMLMWARKDKNAKFLIKKRDIKKFFFISPTIFKNQLTNLMSLDLIKVADKEDNFIVEMMGKTVDEH